MHGRIRLVAVAARREFEQGLILLSLLKKLYQKYNPEINDLDAFMTQAWHIFPKGNCGLTTVYLQHKLGGEIMQGRYGHHNHTFLLINDTLVDITADQFGGPDVYVGSVARPWSI